MAGNGRKLTREEPIHVAVENLRLAGEGVYQIDLSSLMRGDPLVVRMREGIYRVDLSSRPRVA
jgi:predicted  nucleic acid-binding Zn-ribbon protein